MVRVGVVRVVDVVVKVFVEKRMVRVSDHVNANTNNFDWIDHEAQL